MDSVILTEFIVAFLIAAILTIVYAGITISKRKRTGFFWFFLIVFMVTWSGGIWLQPSIAISGELRWWPFLIVGFPFALLIAIFGPRKPPEGRHETLEKLEEMAGEKELEELTYTTLKIVFWFVLFVMAAAIVFRYATRI
jgi:hypothetical protein